MTQLNLFNTLSPFPGRSTEKGVELFLKVTPKAAKNRIGDVCVNSNGSYFVKVYVNAPAENNQANIAVIELLSKTFKLPKSSFQLLYGHTSRQKTILIESANIKDIQIYF